MMRIFFYFLLCCLPAGLPAQSPAPPSSCGCCTPAHRQFDFWLGEWEVYSQDTLAGTNRISLLQDSCLLREEWTSARSGYTGTSYNYYDARTQQWYQTWVDNQGGALRLSGGLVQHQMVLQSDRFTGQDGKERRHRITWTPLDDGGVRQHWQLLDARDEPLQTIFDGSYRRAGN